MGSFWGNFVNTPGGYRRRGLGRWFQILEERFMALFWANLLCVVCGIPFWVALFFFCQTGDVLALACLHAGWILMGPAVTALNFLCMQCIRDKHIWLWQDFWNCMKREWKQSMLFSGLTGLLWGSFVYALRLVIAVQGSLGIIYLAVFALNAFVVMGLTVFGYQQIAMVQLPFYGVLKNGFLLIFAGKGRSVAAVLLALAVLGLCIWFYEYCVFILLLGVPALTVMTSNLIFYPVFEDFFPEETE